MTRNHARRRWPAFERLEERRRELCETVMGFDRAARNPWNRELWRALQKAPPRLAARYARLCRISAMYRVAAVLGGES